MRWPIETPAPAFRGALRGSTRPGEDGRRAATLAGRQGRVAVPDSARKDDDGWRFDAAAGRGGDPQPPHRQQRAVGDPGVPARIVDAQREYYAAQPAERRPLLQYAQKFVSTTGKRDGLYWDTVEDEEPSPLGPRSSRRHAPRATRSRDAASPTHGYRYRILTAQGPTARAARTTTSRKGR